MTKVVVFVPLAEEMRYAFDEMIRRGCTCHDVFDPKTLYYNFHFVGPYREPVNIDFHVVGDMGNLRTAVRIAPVLKNEEPDLCLLIGIAGSMSRAKADIGDVVVSTRVKSIYPDKVRKREDTMSWLSRDDTRGPVTAGVLALDKRKQVMDESFFRYRREAVDASNSAPRLQRYIRHIESAGAPLLQPVNQTTVKGIPADAENDTPQIRVGAIFSSEMVIDSAEYLTFIEDRDSDPDQARDYYTQTGSGSGRQRWIAGPMTAVDMETLGFFEAVRALVPRETVAISVRGISDLASQKAELDGATEDKVRDIAVRNALIVAMDMAIYLPSIAKGN